MMKRIIMVLIAFCLGALGSYAQTTTGELNARITINSDKIQGSDKQIFTTLQEALNEFVNNRRWTDATFAINERIDCTMTIIVREYADNSFKSEIQVQARRPVYNSSYTTTLLNYRDTELNFDYVQFEQLEYAENTLTSNLTATIVYYIYVILGLDFDSFSPLGGKAYFDRAQQIVSMAQSQSTWNGWKAFDKDDNRHGLITALTDNTSEIFRNFWYTYHRKGLDEMAGNPDRGRTTIIQALPSLKEIKSMRPTSVVLRLLSDAKLDEIVSIYSKATTQEKQAGYKLLYELYPTETRRLEPLQK